jgi:hypothetical protein
VNIIPAGFFAPKSKFYILKQLVIQILICHK